MNAKLAEPRRIEQQIHQFVQRGGLQHISRGKHGRRRRARSGNSKGLNAVLVLQANDDTYEVGKIFAVHAAVPQTVQKMMLERKLADGRNHGSLLTQTLMWGASAETEEASLEYAALQR